MGGSAGPTVGSGSGKVCRRKQGTTDKGQGKTERASRRRTLKPKSQASQQEFANARGTPRWAAANGHRRNARGASHALISFGIFGARAPSGHACPTEWQRVCTSVKGLSSHCCVPLARARLGRWQRLRYSPDAAAKKKIRRRLFVRPRGVRMHARVCLASALDELTDDADPFTSTRTGRPRRAWAAQLHHPPERLAS